MPGGAHVTLGADGRAVVAKEAEPGPAADRLRHEVAVLRRAAHPAVVELVAVEDWPDGGLTVHTAFVGAAVGPADVVGPRAARLLAGVATTLADLHEGGVVHGRVVAEHVLVAADGSPVLCGFGDATLEGGDPAADVAALAALGAGLVQGVRSADADELRRTLARAGADDPSLRPAMRAVAVALHALRPRAELAPPERVLAPRRPTGRTTRGPGRPVVLAGAVATAVLVGLGLLLLGGGGADPGTTAPTSTVTRPATTASSAPPCPVEVGPVVEGADVDGDGCSEPVRVAGHVVEVAGVRWSVGEPGDVAVVGDWDCDGRATVATLRPGTGRVWQFPSWPGPSAEVRAEPAATVAGAEGLRATDPDGDGCPLLSAVTPAGATTPLLLG